VVLCNPKILQTYFILTWNHGLTRASTTMCLHVNRTAHVACDFNCVVKSQGHFKVTGTHAHGRLMVSRKRCKRERRCYYRSLTGSDIMTYRIVIKMTLSDLLQIVQQLTIFQLT